MNNLTKHHFVKVVLSLLAVTLATVSVVTLIQKVSAERIAAQREQDRLASLYELLPDGSADWELTARPINAPGQFQTDAPIWLYQAIDDDTVRAIVISFTTHDGYNGDIELLAAFDNTGQLLGVRTGSHIETPGIGDAIDIKNDDWILQFSDISVYPFDEEDWQWQRDGGRFDQLTGATITANAVLRAINRVVEYYQDQRDNSLAPPESDQSSS